MARLVRAATDRNPPTLGGGGCQNFSRNPHCFAYIATERLSGGKRRGGARVSARAGRRAVMHGPDGMFFSERNQAGSVAPERLFQYTFLYRYITTARLPFRRASQPREKALLRKRPGAYASPRASSAATEGRTLPSSSSREAPPPVEI